MTTTQRPDAAEPTTLAARRLGSTASRPDFLAIRGPFRRDVQGMRAVAVVAVVLSHAGLGGFDGGYVGVDVFFVVSAFLITDQLLRELGRTGTIRFGAFYARRIRRLLPAAATVVVASGVVTLLFESSLAARHWAEDTLWAAAYAVNIELAMQGTDYFAAESTPSTLRHLWSLAVEEQFYVVWPLLLLVTGVLLSRNRTLGFARGRVAAGLVVVVGLSLGLSIWQTREAPSWAYFGLHTRAWEFGAGALAAVALPWLHRLPATAGRAMSWAGLGAIALAVASFSERTALPGHAALLPVVGATLVIVGGSVTTLGGAGRLLGTAPFQAIGAVSYSWYLWHWPFLMLMPAILGWEPTVLNHVFVVFVSLLVATIAYTNVEMPLRTARWLAQPRRGLLLGGAVTVVLSVTAALALVALPPAVGSGTPVTVAAGDVSAVQDSLDLQTVPSNLTPSLEEAPDDVPASRGDACHLALREERVNRPCDYGDVSADHTMVLLGDSHADAWLPALDRVAGDNGYRLLSRTKSACPAVDMEVRSAELGREYRECSAWRAEVMAEVAEVRPDVVVMSSSFGVSDKSPGDWGRATTSTVSALTELGITAVFINDTPRREEGHTGPDCVAANLEEVSQCVTPEKDALPYGLISSAVLQAVQRSGGITVDPTNWFCADGLCPAVIGNYLVYRDESHVTASYMSFLAPELERALQLN